MNNDDKNVVNQNPNLTPPIAQVQPQVATPVGSSNKEVSPIMPSGAEVSHEINQELKDLGVEEKKDRPEIKDEDFQFIQHAGPSVPVQTTSSGQVSLPMSEEEVEKELKMGKSDDSAKWYAVIIQKVRAVMGL